MRHAASDAGCRIEDSNLEKGFGGGFGLHQAEFFHAPAQGRDGQVEYFGGAASAAHHALRVTQDLLDVRTLGVGECEQPGGRRGRGVSPVITRRARGFQLREWGL